MPIRFTCPHCHQKLSVGQRKAGAAAECPRCKRALTIPLVPASASIDNHTPGAIHPELPVSNDATAAPAGEAAVFLPEVDEFVSLELVYDNAPASSPPKPPPPVADVIVVPRYILYLQGGLIAGVALAAFAIGTMMGATLAPKSAPVEMASHITGSVTYASGPRRRADAGAVVVAIPVTPHRPTEKAPIAGLRPGDSSPDAENKGEAILRQMGGSYARADANGLFDLEVPSRGRYVLLIISHEKQSRSSNAAKPADISRLAPFFDNAAGLIGDHHYRLMQEVIRGDRELAIVFD
jgi:hypothetical protein